MQISNLYKKRIVSALVLCTMLFVSGYILGELLRPFGYATDVYLKEYQDLKKQNTKVDMILIGNSRVQRTFSPKIFEEKLNLSKAYNLSVTQVNMGGLYYQLKEFIEEFHPKYVIIGITERALVSKSDPKISKLFLLERLHGINRMEYIWNNFSLEDYPFIINIFSYRNYFSSICSNVYKKQQLYNKGVYVKTEKTPLYERESMGNGFLAYHDSVPHGNMGFLPVKRFDKSQISDNTKQYLDKCVQICKDNGVQVFFVSPPTSMSHIYSISNFQDIVDYIVDYAKANGVPYYNLNFLKDREIYLPDSMMYDYKHTNKYGAYIISEKYAEILAKNLQGIDTSDYFYGSLNELKESVDRVVAVGAKPIIKNNIMSLSVQSFQNKDVIPYYQVLLATKENEFNTIVDWTSKKNISFKVPKGSRYRVLLRARHKKDTLNYAWMAWEVDKKGKIRIIRNISSNGA